MTRPTVVVLGASGMLGSMCVDVLSRDPSLNVIATVRDHEFQEKGKSLIPNVQWDYFEIKNGWTNHAWTAAYKMINADWIINCIGITKPYIHDDKPIEVARAIYVNSLFPWELAIHCKGKILQIGTDCVYSGQKGNYDESCQHDATDSYGKTKSLGEVQALNVQLLRTSIIGPEPQRSAFLVEWLLSKGINSHCDGYVNHHWNGITTLHFAKICQGIITNNSSLLSFRHVVPTGMISKDQLLKAIATCYNRADIVFDLMNTGKNINRVLSTNFPDDNQKLWELAGYPIPPTIPDMIQELSQYEFRFKNT